MDNKWKACNDYEYDEQSGLSEEMMLYQIYN